MTENKVEGDKIVTIKITKPTCIADFREEYLWNRWSKLEGVRFRENLPVFLEGGRSNAEPGVYEVDFKKQFCRPNFNDQIVALAYSEQNKDGWCLSHPVVIIKAVFDHFDKTGEILMINHESRTSFCSEGRNMVVGPFNLKKDKWLYGLRVALDPVYYTGTCLVLSRKIK